MLTPFSIFAFVLLITLVCLFLQGRIERYSSLGDDASTIFVSVASYRDDECSKTLQDMFKRADNPRRVYAGVCEQNKTGDVAEQCLRSEVLSRNRENVRIVTLDYTQAKGPTFARYVCSTLYRGENYFVQIDSHTRFVQGWDTKVIDMLRRCPTQPAVITHYAPEIGAATSSWKEGAMVPVLCDASFNDDGIPVFKAILKQPVKGLLKPTPFVSGNFWASEGRVLRDVPFDPDLPHLFMGEELLQSVRLWTSGYDLYVPERNLVMHEYGRREKPKYWNDLADYRRVQKETLKKVRYVLGLSDEAPMHPVPQTHGLGRRRSLKAYWDYAKIDPKAKTVSTPATFCPASGTG